MTQATVDPHAPTTDAGIPFGVDIDLVTGVMQKPDRVLVRRASDMKG